MDYKVIVRVLGSSGTVIDEDEANHIHAGSDMEAMKRFDKMVAEAHEDTGYEHRGKPYKAILVDEGSNREVKVHMGTVP